MAMGRQGARQDQMMVLVGRAAETAATGLEATGAVPDADAPADLVADRGYHSRAVLKDLDGSPWRSRIAEPKRKDVLRWQGDHEARRAVYGNRVRLRLGVAKDALKLRAERVERSFEHTLDRGGLRRTHLRGQANVQKRYLIHVAGFNLGLVMRLLLGAGTPILFRIWKDGSSFRWRQETMTAA